MKRITRLAGYLGVWMACGLMAACGGGAGSTPPVALAPLTLSGTAATGLALAQAQVQAKCLIGDGSTTTQADGSYRLTIAGGSLPCVLRVISENGGGALHSVAMGTGLQATVNLTPLTELLVARATQMEASAFFDRFNATAALALSSQRLANAQAELNAFLAGTIDTRPIADFLSTPLVAATLTKPSDDVQDKILDMLRERVSSTTFKEWLTLLSSGRPLPDPAPFKPQIALSPKSITVGVGQMVDLRADLNYASLVRFIRQPVAWSVVEAGGGGVVTTAAGATYTAPEKPGVYYVKATREDYADVSALVTITVEAQPQFVPTLELENRYVTLMPGQSFAFTAVTNYPPNVRYIRQPVTWTVVEPTGSSITLNGLYIAPNTAGIYHVKVTREDFPELSATAEVKVGNYQDLTPIPFWGALRGPEQLVIRSEAAWEAWKKEHQAQEGTDSRWPSVDFSKHMVVSIVLPGQGACDRTTLTDIKPENGKLTARINITPPPPNMVCIAMVVFPTWLIAVPQSDLPLDVIVTR